MTNPLHYFSIILCLSLCSLNHLVFGEAQAIEQKKPLKVIQLIYEIDIQNISSLDAKKQLLTKNTRAIRARLSKSHHSTLIVERHNENQIMIIAKNATEAQQIKKQIATEMRLEFRLEATTDTPPEKTEVIPFQDKDRGKSTLEKHTLLTDKNLMDIYSSSNSIGNPIVIIHLDEEGGATMNKITKNLIDQRKICTVMNNQKKLSV